MTRRRRIRGIGWLYAAIVAGLVRVFAGSVAIQDGLLVLAIAFFCVAVLRMWWAAAYESEGRQ